MISVRTPTQTIHQPTPATAPDSEPEPKKSCPYQEMGIFCRETDHIGPGRFNACKNRIPGDWRDGCNLPYPSQEHDRAIREQAKAEERKATTMALASIVTEEMVYDDGDMYYKVNPEHWVKALESLRQSPPPTNGGEK